MNKSHVIGREAENRAIQYLISKGYHILVQNFYYRKAEIDINARKNNLLVVIKVKVRSSKVFGAPESFVSTKKMKLLRMDIDAYVTNNNLYVEVRFDIISYVINGKNWQQNHIENLLYPFN